MFWGCDEMIDAIDTVKDLSFEDLVIDAVPIDEETVRAWASGKKDFKKSDLFYDYLKVFNRIKRIAKLYQLNAPRIIMENERRMLTEVVEALFRAFGRREIFPWEHPLYETYRNNFLMTFSALDEDEDEDEDDDDVMSALFQSEESCEKRMPPCAGFYLGEESFLTVVCADHEREGYKKLLDTVTKGYRAYDLYCDIKKNHDVGTLKRASERVMTASAVLVFGRIAEEDEFVETVLLYAAATKKMIFEILLDPSMMSDVVGKTVKKEERESVNDFCERVFREEAIRICRKGETV